MATIEIDGKTIEVENGKMIIEVADEQGIYIPRFCYHKKLSVAANCRMCLVEVENNRKTVPACATPITNGMKVFTKSKEAIRSQAAVMDFLLINHPLDCPICDQGGECELQDVSMGYGRDESSFDETKRSVASDDIGSLIAMEMTRCIHCTRCVRFGTEVAGVPELGGIGRGEDLQIGTYVKHSVTSEVSGNMIDLCPVGALTSKPYRFTARAWEMTQHDSIAPHDCLGSNVHLHTRRNKLMRVAPKECESINEMWLSDRDRFSYLGLNSTARAKQPMIKRNGQWEVVEWPQALAFAADGMSRVLKQYGSEQFAAFASASSTLEELFLLQKLMRSLNINNLDYRLQQTDFRDQAQQPTIAEQSLPYAELENQQAILLLGCNLDREVPLAGLRVRKAFLNGAVIHAINPVDYNFHFEVAEKIIVSPQQLPQQIAAVVLALADDLSRLPSQLQALLANITVTDTARIIAKALCEPNAAIVTGALFTNHPDAAILRTLLAWVKQLSGAHVISFTAGANSAGAKIAGMLPHVAAAGKVIDTQGLDVCAALDAKLKGYLLMGVEPGFDFANPYRARQSMLAAEFVVVLSAFEDESIQEYANVILPMAPFAETSGTYVNVDGLWQTVKGAISPYEQARPAWKILRVLANLLHVDEFNYESSQDILSEIKILVDMMHESSYKLFYPEQLPAASVDSLVRVGEWPLYRQDAIVRHAKQLQACASSEVACVRMHPITADKLQLDEFATVSQNDIEIRLPLVRDEAIALDVIWVPNAMSETVDLGHAFSTIKVK